VDLLTVTGLLNPYAQVTLTQAGDLCRVSLNTVEMRLRRGRFPHAVKSTVPGDRVARWRIPIADLVDDGLLGADRVQPRTAFAAPAPAAGGVPVAVPGTGAARAEVEVEVLRAQVARLEDEVAWWRSQHGGGTAVAS
jgi:hypothetical protein